MTATWNRYRLSLLASALVLLLSGCVTTTTGGFNVDASAEQAVQDYVQLAIAYYDAGDMQGARRHLDNARRINERHPAIYNVIALVLQTEGDLDLAEENFRRAIALDRDNSRARNNYAVLLFGQGRYREAYEQLQPVTQDVNYPGRAIAFENLGRAALRIGEEDDAVRAFTRALQLNTNLYVSSLELAILRADRGEWDAAWRRLQQYITTVDFYGVPHTPRALLAGIQIGQQRHDQELVDNFVLILTTLYQDSPEYVLYQRLTDAN
ncbi:MAG: type IV pilus biogenesis/stability protein PilW [Pseudohongiellaceae bacterium]